MGGVTDIIMVMIVLAGAYILIKSGKLGEIVGGNFQLPQLPGIPTQTPAAPTPSAAPIPTVESPESEGAQAPEGESSGDESEPAQAPEGGGGGGGGPAPTGTGCGGGTSCASSNGGSRNECDGISFPEYEATWCGSFSGDDLSIKTFGPNHSGSSCCWCILSVSPDGAFGLRHEGPHPSTSDKQGTTAAIGKPECVKAIVRRGSGGINLEGWGLVGGQWKKAFSYQGQCGDSKKSSTPASAQQISFRCDGSLNTTCATVRPLGGAQAAAIRVRGYKAYNRILSRL